jgi:hypothetical protein
VTDEIRERRLDKEVDPGVGKPAAENAQKK